MRNRVIYQVLGVLFFVGFTSVGMAQNRAKNYGEFKKMMNAKYDNNESVLYGKKHYKRAEIITDYFFDDNSTGDERNIRKSLNNEYRKISKLARGNSELRHSHGQWEEYSFSNSNFGRGIGRVNSISKFGSTMIAGSAGGGVWRSTDNGSSWSCISDHIFSGGVVDVIVDPDNLDNITAMVGNGWRHSFSLSTGLIQTTDGGENWSHIEPFTNNSYFAAARSSLINSDNYQSQLAIKSNQISLTDDAWQSFDILTNDSLGISLVHDAFIDPEDSNNLFVADEAAIYRYDRANDSLYILLVPSIPSDVQLSRVKLYNIPQNPDAIFAVYVEYSEDENNNLIAIYKSTNEGLNWTLINDDDADYDNNNGSVLSFWVDPNDDDVMMIGGTRIEYTKNNWNTSETIGQTQVAALPTYIHADVNDILYVATEDKFYFATDGGIFSSPNDFVGFEPNIEFMSNGMKCSQIYYIDVHNGHVVAGLQDNGTKKWSGNNSNGEQIHHSDGFQGYFEMGSETVEYASTQTGRFFRNPVSVMTKFRNAPGEGQWDQDWIVSPTNSDRMFHANIDVYRNMHGHGTFEDFHKIADLPGEMKISALHLSTDENTLYVARNDTFLVSKNPMTSDPDNVTFTSLADSILSLGMMTIESITTDHQDPDEVYILNRQYGSPNKVLTLQNNQWINISGSLPNVPLKKIIHDGNTNDGLYVGTAIGVFYRNNDLGDWIFYGNNLPVCPVMDMKIANNYLYIGTWGRGVWRSNLYESKCNDSYDFTFEGLQNDNPMRGKKVYTTDQTITSDRTFIGESSTNIIFNAGGHVLLKPGTLIPNKNTFTAMARGCNEILTNPE